MSGVFVRTTQGIKVTAMPSYLAEQSSPEDAQYVWAYTIRIENHSAETVQLIDRHWRITDDTGQLQTVDGPGVVGEQPILEAGMIFQYTSGAVLSTSSGMMEGSYGFEQKDSGLSFDVAIPAFSLDSPASSARPN